MDNPYTQKMFNSINPIIKITSSTATAIHATSDAFFLLFNALIPCKQALFIVSEYRGNRA